MEIRDPDHSKARDSVIGLVVMRGTWVKNFALWGQGQWKSIAYTIRYCTRLWCACMMHTRRYVRFTFYLQRLDGNCVLAIWTTFESPQQFLIILQLCSSLKYMSKIKTTVEGICSRLRTQACTRGKSNCPSRSRRTHFLVACCWPLMPVSVKDSENSVRRSHICSKPTKRCPWASQVTFWSGSWRSGSSASDWRQRASTSASKVWI